MAYYTDASKVAAAPRETLQRVSVNYLLTRELPLKIDFLPFCSGLTSLTLQRSSACRVVRVGFHSHVHCFGHSYRSL